MQTLPWIVALAALALLALVLALWAFNSKPKKSLELPTEWALTARPVFSTDERRVYRLLREALPHHIVLSKLPLVRFCQPTDPNEVRYWFDLLGSSHVTFAVCSANGRVLAAIDLDTDRGNSRRVMQIKQSVLSACRVRYLRCPVDQLPSVAELQLLVPSSSAQSRGPQPASAPSLHQARDALSHTVASRRAARTALWQDSTVFQDSFFAPDSRDGFGASEFSPLNAGQALRTQPRRAGQTTYGNVDDRPEPLPAPEANELGGVVVDAPQYTGSARH
ncbi:MAG: DUF2726 domain-containing protein [Burkholderiales bacterium]|nr:DUF2726 domain-containing protein [Burkholderiales bacterium]MDE2626457.1 DUF2726 domain-containing protein [Burkholderiales bacterium]